MRIAGVGIDGHVGAFVRVQACGGEFRQDPLLQIVFGERSFLAHAIRSVFERSADDAVNGFACILVGPELRVRPAGFVFLHQVGGADYFDASGANRFDRSGIDHGDVRDGVLRRILHGDGFCASQNFAQTFGEFFHTRVE